MMNSSVVLIGSPWILREGLKQTLKRLELIVCLEGDTFDDAALSSGPQASPCLVLVLVGQSTDFAAALNDQRKAGLAFPAAKRAIVAEHASAANVASAIEAGLDALLLSSFSGRMLTNSLQLVLHNQKLFPSPGLAAIEIPPTLPVSSSTAISPPASSPLQLARVPQPNHSVHQSAQALTTHEQSHVIRLEHRSPVRPLTTANIVWSGHGPKTTEMLRPVQPSEREWEILRCLALGGSNKSIARELGIAETTVKVHIKSLLRKLGAANRTQAAIWAIKHADAGGEPPDKLGKTVPAS